MNTQQLFNIKLDRNVQHHVSVDAGTVVRATSGVVRVTEPFQWLGCTVVNSHHVVTEGDELTLKHGGWIELTALHGTAHVVHGVMPGPVAILMQQFALTLKRWLAVLNKDTGLYKS